MEFLIFPLFFLAGYSFWQADSNFRKAVQSLRAMEGSRIEGLPVKISDGLKRRSNALPGFVYLNWELRFAIAFENTAWAKDLPGSRHVAGARKWLWVSLFAFPAFNAAFFSFLLEKSHG